jgi:hypothetical protein
MATKKSGKGNGAAAAPYDWKIKPEDRVRFIKNTHSEFTIERELHGLEGVVTNREITDSLPAICIKFDNKAGAAWVHPDDCELLLSAGNERPVEEPGDHETAAVQTASATSAGPKEPFDMGEVSRDCACPLPTDVIIAKAKRLGAIPDDIKAIEDKLAQQKQLAKDLIGGLEGERSVLSAEVRDGTEMKPVVCKWIGDTVHKLKRLVRTDTFEVVEEHTLTAAECQDALDFDQPDTYELDGDDEPASDEPERELTGSDDGDHASASAH